MRSLIFIIAVVLILALLGWITFSSTPGKSSINIETQKIEQDTDQALEKGAEALQKAGDSIDSSLRTDSEPSSAAPTTPAPPSEPAAVTQ
jgi:hypothetical protein